MKSQETRSRTENRKIARSILAEKLEYLEKGPDSRTALKGAIKVKKKASSQKKSKRKYKKLAEEKESTAVVDVDAAPEEAGERTEEYDARGSRQGFGKAP